MDKEIELLTNVFESFNITDDIERKYNHMFRVSRIAGNIAESLNLSNENITLAKICGLFHDIGRFKQLSEYNTYDDYASLDHGDAGAMMLDELGYDNDIVKKSVKYHNKKDIPTDLTDEELMFLNITRDADKLDIYETQGLVNDDISYEINDHIRESFKNHTQIDKRFVKYDINSHTQNILLMLAFTFDLKYEYGIKYLKDNGIIKEKLKLIKDKINDYDYELIESSLNEFLEERVS